MITGHHTEHARDLAANLLGRTGDRWRHTVAVADRAAELSTTVPTTDRDLLVAAAWLHDIGYAKPTVDTGFHPLDGARHLDRLGWPRRVAALVAHHSGARFVAAVLGLDGPLDTYPREAGPVADALTYADQTVDSRGHRVSIRDRLADMLHRHGPDSPNARAHHVREPHLLAVAQRVEARAASA
ncbi:HDIG domain-containing protein [Saccharothrix sp. S26]|uniref:HD domain-containing protein n=1 Tax=Saccharothrix sp. S26 TaxID=2907215 RepID=UPI001F4160EC|nr:HD domain-containing protein [Saccharothrix sp. S26]MCE6997306.1 HDIG domain-containing protein [Saccharothrix sp. S26]